MNPEEKELLVRTLKLSEENNKMLKSMKRSMRWAKVWGFVKILLYLIPLAVGYIYLQPYFGSISDNLKNASTLLNSLK